MKNKFTQSALLLSIIFSISACNSENNNKYDSNAIAVYGKSSTGERKLGYIAAEIADDLVYNELDDKIKARLIGVEIKETPFIEYEILVKKASD